MRYYKIIRRENMRLSEIAEYEVEKYMIGLISK